MHKHRLFVYPFFLLRAIPPHQWILHTRFQSWKRRVGSPRKQQVKAKAELSTIRSRGGLVQEWESPSLQNVLGTDLNGNLWEKYEPNKLEGGGGDIADNLEYQSQGVTTLGFSTKLRCPMWSPLKWTIDQKMIKVIICIYVSNPCIGNPRSMGLWGNWRNSAPCWRSLGHDWCRTPCSKLNTNIPLGGAKDQALGGGKI